MKIADYDIDLRDSYTGLRAEAWQRENGDICLYIWPYRSGETAVMKDGEVIIVDWNGPAHVLEVRIGDAHDWPTVCTVPEPELWIGLIGCILALLIIMRLKKNV